jgi:hypothetical protein
MMRRVKVEEKKKMNMKKEMMTIRSGNVVLEKRHPQNRRAVHDFILSRHRTVRQMLPWRKKSPLTQDEFIMTRLV